MKIQTVMNQDKKGMFQMRTVLVGILFLITFFTHAQEDEGSIPKTSIEYGFSSSDFKLDAKYSAAKPDFDLKNYLIESLGDTYPEGEKGKDFLRVNIIMDITKTGKVTNIIYQVDNEYWHPSELEKLEQVIEAMPAWIPSKKKGKEIDSKILLSFTIHSSYSIFEKHVARLGQSNLEIYDKLPDEEIIKKEVTIIIEFNGQVHFSSDFEEALKSNHPQKTQDILNNTLQNLHKESRGSSNENKEYLITLSFKKVRDPGVSQERLDSIKIIMDSGDKFFKEVDQEASFPEGKTALIAYLKKGTGNAKKLVISKYAKLGKKVYVGVSYVVTREGKISTVRIAKGKEKLSVNGRKSVIKMFQEMPEWSPALKLGVPVNKKYFQKVVLNIK